MIALAPFQAAAVHWFLGLAPRRGAVTLPVGSGKTRIALAIANAVLSDGPALVVVPVGLAGAWADQAAQLGLDATVVLPRNLPALISLRNQAAHGGDAGRAVWIVSDRMAETPAVKSTVETIPWSIAVFDEAHQTARGTIDAGLRAQATLFLTATPGDGDWAVADLPVFALSPDALRLPEVRPRLVEVQPTGPEASFLAAIRDWEERAPTGTPGFRRSLIARQCQAGVLPGIEAIESTLARGSEGRDQGSEGLLSSTEQGELSALLDLAYAIDLPDSRSARVIEEVSAIDPGRVVIVATFVSLISYLAALARQSGLDAVAVTGTLDKMERADAIHRSHLSGTLLVLGDGALGGSAPGDRDVLVHGDLPSDERLWRRAASLMDSSTDPGRVISSVVIRWAPRMTSGAGRPDGASPPAIERRDESNDG